MFCQLTDITLCLWGTTPNECELGARVSQIIIRHIPTVVLNPFFSNYAEPIRRKL